MLANAVTDNSMLYSGTIDAGASGADTASTGNTVIDAIFDSAHGESRSTFKSSAPVSPSGSPYDVGAATGVTGNSLVTYIEVDPVNGTITEDASTPAAANSNTATTVTTAAFNPPPGSLLVAIVLCNGSTGTPTMQISSSITLAWTRATSGTGGVGVTPTGLFAGIYYAVVPPSPAVTTTSVPGGMTTEPYSFTLNATSGTPGTTGYTWAVTSGALPPGLSLSGAGVISGTPAATGVFSFTATATDSIGEQGSATFGLVVNASSTPGGTIYATWAMAAGAEYSYGTTPVPVSTRDHDWLFVSVSWMASEDSGIAYVTDSVRNLYQAGPLASSGQANTQVFIVPNARATSVIYVSTSAFVRWLTVQVTDVTGLQPGYVVDASQIFTSGPATSLTESLTTANPDFILAVAALSGVPQTVSQAGSGVTWAALTGSFNGSATAGITQSAAWALPAGAASPSLTFTGLSGYWSGVMIAVKSAGGLPVNPNPAWPVVSAQAAFGYTPQQPTVEPTWTDITSRFLGLNGQRGRSFELDEIAAADMTATFDNFDGALNPQNTASPYYPNVTLITPVRVIMTWQGRSYSLFRGLFTALPQTYDFQRGLVASAVSDDFSKLPQILLATCMIQEMLYDNPLDLWPLNDQQGAPYASNWSGRSPAELVPTVASQATTTGGSVTGGGTAPPSQLTVKIFGMTFPISSGLLTASTGTAAAVAAAPATPSTSSTPATGFGNAQSGTYPGGLAGTTDTVWGNTTTQASSGSPYQGTVLVDSNDSTLPLTATGATYSVWAQMFNTGTSINGSTGAMVMTLTDQNGTGGGREYLAVYYNGTQVTVSQTAGSYNYTPSASLFDSKWHLWTVTISTGGVVTVYVDAVQVGSFTGSFPSGTPTMLQWGGDATVTATSSAGLFTGCMSLAGVYDRVVDLERIQAWLASGVNGFLDELAGNRIQHVLAWARWSAPQAIDMGLSLQQQFNYLTGGYGSSGLTGAIGNYATAGGSAAIDTGAQADMTIQDIANTENGLLAMWADGSLLYRNRGQLDSFPSPLPLGDMDYPLNQTYTFRAGTLGEWTTASNCTVAISGGWSYEGGDSALMTVTGTPPSASVTGARYATVPGAGTGFGVWVMSPQGCYAQAGINWYGIYADTYSGTYLDTYGVPGGSYLMSATSGTLTWCPPMTPVFLTVPGTPAPGGANGFQGVVTIGASPAAGTQLYFDRPRLSPAGFQCPYLENVQITEDIQYLFNDIAVTRNVDQAAYRARNSASRLRYYPRIYTRTIFSSADDVNALPNCANTLLNAYQLPALRVASVTVDAASNPELWPFVLGTDIGDLVQFTRTPVGGAPVTGPFLVLSIEVDYAPGEAQFTYVLCPSSGVF